MRAQFYLRVRMDDKFIIPLNELTAGENRFSWQIGKEFFESFENTEILDAQLDIDASVEKSGRYVGVDCDVCGRLVVECDRCLDELEMPVDVEIRLSVKFGEADASEEVQEGEREVIFIPVDNAELDMAQIVYDYVCTSLPLQRMHEVGECNPVSMRYFSASEDERSGDAADVTDNPFAALKEMFKQ